jgi:hypothetical protein
VENVSASKRSIAIKPRSSRSKRSASEERTQRSEQIATISGNVSPASSAFGSDQLQGFGRCVGHGDTPLRIKAPSKKPQPKFRDLRKGDHGFGVNGHVSLEFNGPTLATTYLNLQGTELVKEEWSVDAGRAIL